MSNCTHKLLGKGWINIYILSISPKLYGRALWLLHNAILSSDLENKGEILRIIVELFCICQSSSVACTFFVKLNALSRYICHIYISLLHYCCFYFIVVGIYCFHIFFKHFFACCSQSRRSWKTSHWICCDWRTPRPQVKLPTLFCSLNTNFEGCHKMTMYLSIAHIVLTLCSANKFLFFSHVKNREKSRWIEKEMGLCLIAAKLY